MTAQTMASPLRGQIQQSFRLAGPVLGIGLLLFGVLFHTEVAAAVGVWIDSTAYNHCFLVIPIVAYLIWDRRDRLARARPVPNPWFALAALPPIMAWLLAERLGIMEGRQLMVMALVEIFFLSVLGWRLFYQFAGPLLYLVFLVPFGAFIVPTLQGFTTSFIVHGLNLLNIPNYADGYAIEIPEGSFLVAEACAGLRFLIASLAFGCLYAMLMYRSPLRRGIFIAVSIVLPIIANGFRALGIVVLGHILGNAQAAVADHLIYGWLFFSVVILLQIVLGLPFRQDHLAPAGSSAGTATQGAATRVTATRVTATGGTASQAGDPRLRQATQPRPTRGDTRGVRRRTLTRQERILMSLARFRSAILDRMAIVPSRPVTLQGLATAAAAVVILAAIGPAAAAALNRGSGTDLPATLRPLAFVGACVIDPDRPTEQRDGVGKLWVEHLKCGQAAFTLRLEVFPPRATASRIIAELRSLRNEQGTEGSAVAYIATAEGPRTWRILELDNPPEIVATSLWIDGRPTQVSFDMRLHRAWASVVGSSYAPVALSVTPELDWSKPTVALHNRARDLLALFVQTYRSLPDQVARLSYAAAH
jgi:exosortase A